MAACRIPLGLIVLSTSLMSQPQTGAIHLEVKDPSGAALRASGKMGGLPFQTDVHGAHDFGNLPFGHYSITVASTGFATQVLQVDVESATPVVRTVTLQLRSQATSVDVVAATPLAGTDLTKDQIAAPVRTATAADVQSSGALDLSDFYEPPDERRLFE